MNLAKVLLLNVAMDAFDTSVKVKEEVTDVFPLVLISLDILPTLIRRNDLDFLLVFFVRNQPIGIRVFC